MAAAAGLIRRVSSHLSTIPRPLVSFSSSLDLPRASLAPSEIPSVPRLPFEASMELMAVPKKKALLRNYCHDSGINRIMCSCKCCEPVTPILKFQISRHKRGIRNGPKALKPVPVIVRCLACGRVKLPHFYCCSGKRESDSSS